MRFNAKFLADSVKRFVQHSLMPREEGFYELVFQEYRQGISGLDPQYNPVHVKQLFKNGVLRLVYQDEAAYELLSKVPLTLFDVSSPLEYEYVVASDIHESATSTIIDRLLGQVVYRHSEKQGRFIFHGDMPFPASLPITPRIQFRADRSVGGSDLQVLYELTKWLKKTTPRRELILARNTKFNLRGLLSEAYEAKLIKETTFNKFR
jgi:hypothetical protein